MHRSHLLGSTLGLVLCALPALAQTAAGTGPQAWPQPAARTPHAVPHPVVAQETMGGHRGPVAPAGAAREAMAADRMAATQGPEGWLKEAQDALRRGKLGEANELLERAETRVLSRAAPTPLADQPMQGPMLEHSAAARAALGAHDRTRAMQQLDLAMAAARTMDTSATGAGGGAVPAQGGSGLRQGMAAPTGMGPGVSRDGMAASSRRAVVRDQGFAGGSVARAEHLSPPSLPARRMWLAQSGQAPANSMTESQAATPGQRQPTPASPNVAPPGPSTMPAARGGANTPMQGRTGGSTTTAPNAAGNGSGITGAPPAGGGSAGGSAN